MLHKLEIFIRQQHVEDYMAYYLCTQHYQRRTHGPPAYFRRAFR
jgi:hypothetical protein